MTACTLSTIKLASQARKYGLGLVFATQAPKGLHNQIPGNAATQFFGLIVFYARGDRFFYVVLTAFVMISAIMVSYTRARAESLIGSCRVGFMERPERLVLVILGALFNRMAPVLWIIAVLSTITVIHRIQYTWARTNGPEAVKSGQAA